MAGRDDDAAARAERARAIGLHRYQLIREAADPGLSTRARGRLVRAIAAAEHTDPAGRWVRVSRDTGDRWIRAWRRGGFDALVPSPRQSTPRLPAEVIEMAVALKRENRARTAAQVHRILRTQMGWAPGERTLQRHFADLGLTVGEVAGGESVFGRFEAARPNELWTGDALHGPTVAGRKTYLFAFIDDCSRTIVGHRLGYAEDTVGLAAAVRPALGSRGVPDGIYLDNGSAFVDAWLLRACATLGITLTHSTPGRPQGRGKIERVFRTVGEQFLVEITGEPAGAGDAELGRHLVGDLAELNRLFTAWVEQVYHRRVHTETGQPPLQRWLAAGPFPLPTTAALAEAFLWEERRTVHLDRDGLVTRQHLPGRPHPGRAPHRAGVRPLRPDHHPGPAARDPCRPRDPAPDRTPRPPQSPTRNRSRPAPGPDRDRLRRAHRRHPPGRTRPRRQLRRPHPRIDTTNRSRHQRRRASWAARPATDR